MFLKRLDIHGFKSFADQASLTFDRALTCVVGPNGSGKSNIADAVRWVLGEQSSKTLRGKRSEDVIFAGSSGRGKLGMAEVSIVLENDKPTDDLPQAEISITRRVYRDGESEYLINGERVRLQDIALLLSKANTGQKSYAVIGQGLADEIIVASPREREAFFQEATGIRALQVKRDQAVSKLDKTKEEMARLTLVISELSPRLKILRRQRERLDERDRLLIEVKIARETYYGLARTLMLARVGELRVALDGTNSEVAGARKERDALRVMERDAWQEDPAAVAAAAYEKLKRLQSQIRSVEISRAEQWRAYTARLQSGGEQALAAAKEERRLLEESRSAYAEELKQKQVQSKVLLENVSVLEQSVQKLDERIEQAEAARKKGIGFEEAARSLASVVEEAVRELEAAIAAGLVEGSIREVVRRLREVRAAAAPVFGEKSNTGEDMSALLAEARKVRIELSEAQKKSNSIASDVHHGGQRLKDFDAKIAHIDREIDSLSKQTPDDGSAWTATEAQFDAQTTKLAAEMSDVERELAEAEKRRSEWQQRYEESRRSVSAVDQKIETLSRKAQPIADELVRVTTRLEDLDIEAKTKLSPDHAIFSLDGSKPTDRSTVESAEHTMRKLEQRLAQVGEIEESVVADHAKAEEEHVFLTTHLTDVEKAEKDLRSLIVDLDVQIADRFSVGFDAINASFSKFFKTLFGGGTASLRVVEEIIEGSEGAEGEQSKPTVRRGIEIVAVPPGKKNQGVDALSGGEKALTAISLIGAIISVNPPPFVLLDEVDAALDEANAERFAKVVKELERRSQIIAITHNRATMHEADVLYGITMNQDGVSTLLSVSLSDIEKK